jgi:hypothetical protein
VTLPGIATDVEKRAAPTYALLIAQRVDDDTFDLRGAQSVGTPELAIGQQVSRPRLALGELAAAGGLEASEIHEQMFDWSRTNPAVREWVDALRAQVSDDDLRLVVWDSTGFEIPWELLHLRGDPQAGRAEGWLGALVPVARKVTLYAETAAEEWEPLDLGEHTCSGTVLASIATQMTDDERVLARYNADLTPGAALLDRLETDCLDLALVYVAAHGSFGVSRRDLRLGDLRLRDFRGATFPGLVRSHGLVFLNACHSGRLSYDLDLRTALFGFAEVFLRKGASAVIGAVGEVSTSVAHEIASELLEALADQPDLPVAVALRNARRTASAPIVARQPRTEDLKRFFYTFMFVLYGNPYTRIQLPRATADRTPGAAGDD